MKKILIIGVCIVSMLLVGCNNLNIGKEDERTKRNRYNMVYMTTRARQEGNKDEINEYIPDIFLSKEFKERYMEKLFSIKKYNITSFGIRDVKYRICDAKENEDIKEIIFERYSIKEDLEINNEGILEYKIKYLDNKGEEKRLYSKNYVFMYKDKWTMLVIEEGEL